MEINSSGEKNITEEKRDLNMNVKIEELFFQEFNQTRPMMIGEAIEVYVNTDKDFTGTVKFSACGETHAINVKNGYGESVIWTGELRGNYTGKTTFAGDDTFKESTVYTNFEMVQHH